MGNRLPDNWTRQENEDGIEYFYNSVTKESRWERPDSEASSRAPLVLPTVIRTKLHAGEKLSLTRRNESGFWGGYTVAWYGPGEVDLSDVFFGTPQSIDSKKRGTWLPGSFYTTNQRIIFEGENIDKYKIIALEIVDSFTLKSDGLDVLEENGSVSTFKFPKPSEMQKHLEILLQNRAIEKAKHCEEILDYKKAIKLWEKLGKYDQAKRVRETVIKRSGQTVVHGDYIDDRDTTYVDDRDTTIRDSVVSKSSIGAGGDGDDLAAKLQQLAQMHKDGILSDEQFEAAKNKLLN